MPHVEHLPTDPRPHPAHHLQLTIHQLETLGEICGKRKREVERLGEREEGFRLRHKVSPALLGQEADLALLEGQRSHPSLDLLQLFLLLLIYHDPTAGERVWLTHGLLNMVRLITSSIAARVCKLRQCQCNLHVSLSTYYGVCAQFKSCLTWMPALSCQGRR